MHVRKINTGDWVRLRGYGPNPLIGQAVHLEPGYVWVLFYKGAVCWKEPRKSARPAKAKEIERTIADAEHLIKLQEKLRSARKDGSQNDITT